MKDIHENLQSRGLNKESDRNDSASKFGNRIQTGRDLRKNYLRGKIDEVLGRLFFSLVIEDFMHVIPKLINLIHFRFISAKNLHSSDSTSGDCFPIAAGYSVSNFYDTHISSGFIIILSKNYSCRWISIRTL